MKNGLLFALALGISTLSQPLLSSTLAASDAFIVTKEVSYKAPDGTLLKGFLAKPKSLTGQSTPGVLIVHEWWGHNDYTRRRAKMLAELGYVAFALDMYGAGKSTEHPKDAQGFMDAAVKSGQIPARFDAAIRALEADPNVDPNQLAAIGYCFGGRVVLSMAEAGRPLKGVVSFHGALPIDQPIKKDEIKAKMLILNGADDTFVSPETIQKFKKELTDAGANYKFINYPGARHGFTDPDDTRRGKMNHMPLAYNAEADKKSWAEMQAFFKTIFSKD